MRFFFFDLYFRVGVIFSLLREIDSLLKNINIKFDKFKCISIREKCIDGYLF